MITENAFMIWVYVNKNKVLFPKCDRFAYAECYKKYNHEQ